MKIPFRFLSPSFFVVLAFGLWLYLFRAYFLREAGFTSDAISYYEHIQFFVKSLLMGEFPLWDPYWSGGSPNDFFLRRICPYNPLFLIIILLFRSGIPYDLSYLIFLSGYVLLSALGLYFLFAKITKDKVSGVFAAVTLLFSASSTRVFDSYLLFVTVPMIWFFFFLVAFFSSPQKCFALGLTFCLMLLMTTYIPFYFLTVFFIFLILFCLVYPDRLLSVAGIFFSFVKKEKWFVLFCVLAVATASLPGLLFFKHAGQGDVSLSGRHYNTAEPHVLAVQNQSEDSWAVPEEFFYSAYFTDLRRIIFAVVYVPCFAFIPLALGAGIRVSRLMFFLAGWGGIILLITSPFGSPVYSFLRSHVFFFKYFRNLHFLLWFVLIPLFSFFAGEQFRLFREAVDKGSRTWLLVWVLFVHSVLFALLLHQADALSSTYITIFASCLFFLCYVLWPPARVSLRVLFPLLFLLVLQPAQVYSHLVRNVVPYAPVTTYDSFTGRIAYQSSGTGETKRDLFPGDLFPADPGDSVSSGFYFSTANYTKMRSAVTTRAVSRFEHFKFRAFDRVQFLQNGRWDWKEIDYAMNSDQNIVWIDRDDDQIPSLAFTNQPPSAWSGPSADFRIVKLGVNTVRLISVFSHPRFLVWADAYYPAWKARINGRPVPVFCVNGAYKGVFVPAGRAEIVFSYERPFRYFFEIFVMGLFYGIFFWLIALGIRRRFFCG